MVDGASTDETAAVFERSRSPVSRFVSQEDQGVYDAMNRGMAQTRGRYLQFLNAGDTFTDPGALDSVLHVLEKSKPNWLIAGALHQHGFTQAATLIGNLPHVWWRHAVGLQPHCHQATVFGRPLLEALGGHSEAYSFAGDFDVILRAGLIARPYELSRVIVNYEGGGLSERRADDVPRLLGEVRAARLQLSGLTSRANSLWVKYRSFRRRVHRIKHAVSNKFLPSWPEGGS